MKKFAKLLTIILAVTMVLTSMPVHTYAKVKVPSKPTSLSATVSENAVTVKWKRVKGASGYVLYSYNAKSKKYAKKGTTAKTRYKVTKLNSGTTYIYAVKAYKTVKKKKYYSAYSAKLTTSTKPSAVKNLKITPDFTYAHLTWRKVAGATAYQVQYSAYKDFSKGVKTVTVKTNSAKITSLSAFQTYYFRVRALKTLNKKNYYSAYTSITAKTVAKNKLSTVSESTTYQTIRGFGASGAWWSQTVGNWENVDEIMQYLYSEDDGIGLDIYRYNLGAGSADDELVWYWGDRRTESFAESYDPSTMTFTYDWSRDEKPRRCLEAARKADGDDLKVSLFLNSPPHEITRNGKTYSFYDPKAVSLSTFTSNLDIDNYPAFANYVCDVADHFTEEGYGVYEVSPINEPQYVWSEEKPLDGNEHGWVSHEGCHYTPIQCKMVYKQMVNKMKDKPYRVSMFEAGSAEAELSGKDETRFSQYIRNIMSDAVNRNYFNEVSIHSYWRGRPSKTGCRKLLNEKYDSLNVSCTEYCQMNNDTCNGVMDILAGLEGFEHSGLTIEFGVQMARVINDDLTVLNAVEWDWWTACAFGGYADSLLILDNNDHDHVVLPKRYWCLGNYSKFIQPGAVRVKVNEGNSKLISSAFKNTDGSLVIVYVNQTSADIPVNISAGDYAHYSAYTTSETYNLDKTADGEYDVLNTISIPSDSVVSVVLTN